MKINQCPDTLAGRLRQYAGDIDILIFYAPVPMAQLTLGKRFVALFLQQLHSDAVAEERLVWEAPLRHIQRSCLNLRARTLTFFPLAACVALARQINKLMKMANTMNVPW